MSSNIRYKISLSIVIIIFIVFIIGFIRPWLIILGLFGSIQLITISDPTVNPGHIAKLFHDMQLSKNQINYMLGMIMTSSILYLIGMLSLLGGFKDFKSLIVSGGLAIASGLVWLIMYNYLINLFPEFGAKLIQLTTWPYIAIALGAITIITCIFV